MAKKDAEAKAGALAGRHGKLRRSSAWRNIGRFALTAVIVGVLSGASVGAYALWDLASDVKTIDLGGDAQEIEAGQSSLDGEVNILLVGSDSREGQSAVTDGEEGELNDVNLLLHVSEDHKNATVISFPRDTMVPVPSCPGPKGQENYYPAMSEAQLNSTMGEGGLPCVAATLEELTGLDIPYAGVVTFDGVVGVSKALGGVDVCLAEPIVDPKTDLDLPAGEVSLVGQEALQFLRTRQGVGDGGDKSRISNQQVFMSSLMRKLKSAETLSNPVKVYGLAKAGVENLTLSDNMASVQFMQALAGTVKDIDLENITFVQYPTANHPYQEGRLTPDYAAAQVLLDAIKNNQSLEVTAKGEGVAEKDGAAEEDPATEEAPAEEAPTEEAPAEETPAEGDGTEAKPDEKVQLPDSVTGQGAGEVTCSQGRTVF